MSEVRVGCPNLGHVSLMLVRSTSEGSQLETDKHDVIIHGWIAFTWSFKGEDKILNQIHIYEIL